MERKIGEIFELGGEWYQCINGNGCEKCAFNKRKCYTFISNDDPIGYCESDRRKDSKNVIFKKLEKFGEPYFNGQYGEVLQEYKYYIPPITPDLGIHIIKLGIVGIEIKQTKEDMEEKKLNLKPFDIQKAREGKPVCTRDGRKARIICFDKQEGLPIVALVETKKNGRISEEIALSYTNGRAISVDIDSKDDLMMLPEKKQGWVNVYYDRIDGITFSKHPYPSKEEAIKNVGTMSNRVDTIKICWEE